MSLADKVRSHNAGKAAPAPVPAAAPTLSPTPVAAAPARKMGPVSVEVSACAIGAHYILDGAAMDGEFEGTTKGGGGLGFFTTAQGRMQMPLTALVLEVPATAASPAPVPQTAPTLAAVPAPVASAPIAQPAPPAPAGAPVASAAPPWAAGGSAPVAGAAPMATAAPKATRVKRAPTERTAETAAPTNDEFMLFIDCIPNVGYTLLDEYVHAIVSGLQESQGVVDIRFPPNNDHPLGFGRWKGALAAVVRSAPPGKGIFVAFTKGSEFAEVVVEALAPMCAQGALVRGR